MYTEVDVFVSNFTLIDPEIYQLWIGGSSSSEAISMLNQRSVAKQTGASMELIASDVLDHYRTFALLERLLTMPTKLAEQLVFQIDEPTKQMLIEKFPSEENLRQQWITINRQDWTRTKYAKMCRAVPDGRPKTDLSQFLSAYEQCALQMDVLREADLKMPVLADYVPGEVLCFIVQKLLGETYFIYPEYSAKKL